VTAQAISRLKSFVSVVLPIIVTLGGFASFIFIRTEARAEAGERKVDALRVEHREADAGVKADIRELRHEVREMRHEMSELLQELRRERRR
jgi:uncharacterized membrane protein